MATLRSLKIKASTCRRALRELGSYEEEVDKEAAKTTAMKESGTDPYDLKQQVFRKKKKQQAELKKSGEQGAEIRDAESAITEVETLFKQTED